MPYLLVVLLGLVTLACNSVKDIQPADSDSVPLTAVEAVRSRYPQATNILFKTLISEQLWQTNFTQNTVAYQTQVSTRAIVSPVYKELTPYFATYQNLTDQLTIRGGTFSHLQAMDGDTGQTRWMQYQFRDSTYQLVYRVNAPNQARLTLNPLPAYWVTELAQLPPRAQTFFKNHTTSLLFQSGNAIRQADGQFTYGVTASLTDNSTTELFFDSGGNLTWIGTNANGKPVVYTTNDQVGDAAILSTVGASYAGFDAPPAMAFETYYEGLVSVRYAFRRVTATTSELWQVGVQWPSGQVIYARLEAQFTR